MVRFIVILISFVLLSILTTVTVSFGKVEYEEPYLSYFGFDAFSEISRQSDLVTGPEDSSSNINNLSSMVVAEDEPSIAYVSSDAFSDISRSNDTISDNSTLPP
jgi:hypothetical protein